MITIRKYRRDDERDWVRCRVLSMLDTTWYDDVLTSKPSYQNPAVQVVADYNGRIVGLMDVEYDLPIRGICYRRETPGGVIRTLAVLPEYRGEQVATHRLKYACDLLREEGIGHLEAWVRKDDAPACTFFQRRDFQSSYSYYHFYASSPQCRSFGDCRMLDCFIMKVYGEYIGGSPDLIREKADRVYECLLYERSF